MQFANLQYLSLLWLIPLLIFFYAWAFKKKDQAIEAFCGLGLMDKLAPFSNKKRRGLKAFLSLASLFFLVFALTQPKWGFHWEEIRRQGVDIIIALDLSESMLAEDVEPNRLERAKRKIIDLLDMLQGDRVGLVAFAGVSFLECPLTLDYGAAKMFLDYLDVDLIPVQGTALGDAVKTSVDAFGKFGGKSRALILITDGEDLEGDPFGAASLAKKAGVRIFAIGVGKEGGAPIPNRDGGGGFKKDKEGNLVISKLDEATLQKIALETGGLYLRSVTGDLDLIKIYKESIRGKMEKAELQSSKQKKWEERFQLFVFLGLALLIFEFLIPEKGRDKG
jgi:Ca-activated chloride channel family protein